MDWTALILPGQSQRVKSLAMGKIAREKRTRKRRARVTVMKPASCCFGRTPIRGMTCPKESSSLCFWSVRRPPAASIRLR